MYATMRCLFHSLSETTNTQVKVRTCRINTPIPIPEANVASAAAVTMHAASTFEHQRMLLCVTASTETYFLTCLLHDIGTTATNLRATRMSFEFHGGLLALELLQSSGAPKEQAESVCEAIIRHQDLGESGSITTVGQLIQLATVFDNIGMNPELIHKETIESVTAKFPRNKWSSCFAATIREEIGLKPWSHTTAIGGFGERVESNKLMEPYD